MPTLMQFDDLPNDMLGEIAMALKSYADFINFGATCRRVYNAINGCVRGRYIARNTKIMTLVGAMSKTESAKYINFDIYEKIIVAPMEVSSAPGIINMILGFRECQFFHKKTYCFWFNRMFEYFAYDGFVIYFKKGVFHRDNDKPAIEFNNGAKIWAINGKISRHDDKPAIISENLKIWMIDCCIHRENGPAVEIYGERYYYKNNEEVVMDKK